MTYYPGLLKVQKFTYMGSGVGQKSIEMNPPMRLAYLRHSCDEWIIGGVDDLMALRKDIDALLEKGGAFNGPAPQTFRDQTEDDDADED